MSKLIKKYKENYRNFLGIFKGLFEHLGVQLANKISTTRRKGGCEKHTGKKSKNSLGLRGWAWVMEQDYGLMAWFNIKGSFAKKSFVNKT